MAYREILSSSVTSWPSHYPPRLQSVLRHPCQPAAAPGLIRAPLITPAIAGVESQNLPSPSHHLLAFWCSSLLSLRLLQLVVVQLLLCFSVRPSMPMDSAVQRLLCPRRQRLRRSPPLHPIHRPFWQLPEGICLTSFGQIPTGCGGECLRIHSLAQP